MMSGRILVVSLFLMMAAWGTPAANQDNSEREKAERRAKFTLSLAQDAAKRAEISKTLLDQFPDNKHTVLALSHVINYQHGELGDTQAAIAYAESILAQVGNQESKNGIRLLLLDLLSKKKLREKFISTTDQLISGKGMNWGDFEKLLPMTAGMEEWELLLREITAAEQFIVAVEAGPARARFGEERFKELMDTCRGYATLHKAWAMANTGALDESFPLFEKADALSRQTFFGTAFIEDNHTYWGRALMMKGRYDEAADRFAVAYLHPQRDGLVELVREAYVAKNGGVDGFEDYLEDLRLKHSKVMGDFSETDFKGASFSFEKLRGRVTILMFWANPCGSCHDQLLLLKPLFEKYGDRGLAFVAYNLEPDFEKDQKFIADNGLDYAFLAVDEGEDMSGYMSRFGVIAFPTTYLIDGQGRILYYFYGFRDGDETRIGECVERMLNLE